MARRLTVNEVVGELKDSEFEGKQEDDSSDDDFEGYMDEREMFERDDEYDGDRLEERADREDGGVRESEESVGGVDKTIDKGEEGNDDGMQVGAPLIQEYALNPG